MFVSINFKCFSLVRLPNTIARRTVSAALSSNVPETVKKTTMAALSSETYGQPTSWTHPHLINTGELVPGICVDEFQQRRLRLVSGIQKYSRDSKENKDKPQNHIVIVPSSTKKYMSDKIPYVFRQNSDFYYLTGCMEPDSVLAIYIDTESNVKSTIFMRPKDKHAELWDGARTGVYNALDFFGVDEACSINKLQIELSRRINSDKPCIWYDSINSNLSNVTNDVKSITGNTYCIDSPTNFIQSMRLFKSPSEQQLMRRTCRIASESINEVMREARPGHSEHHIFAMVDYKCRMRNASHLAYPPVVASGNNGTTIHYINNSQLTKSGDLVLLDAGCEYAGYTSDITRTWPVSGEFTQPQKVLYDLVQQLQAELIGTLSQEGGDTLDKLFDTMCIKLGKYLQEVGLVAKDISDNQGYAKAGYKFCPHHVSHYLGMDVHDTPLMPRTLKLLPGMVCTVEPGIYIGHDFTEVPKEFRGMGVRIEDDILIGPDNKIEVLTASCLKERKVLENLFKEKNND